MKTTQTLLASIALTGLLASCASTAPTVSYAFDEKEDFHTYESFAFIEAQIENQEKVEAAGPATEEGAQVFRDLIKGELTKKGFMPGAAEEASFWVVAYAGVDRKFDFQPRETIASTDFEKSDDKLEATLVIDIIDPSDKKVVWRSTVKGEFTTKQVAQRDENLELIVAQMMAKFPPGK